MRHISYNTRHPRSDSIVANQGSALWGDWFGRATYAKAESVDELVEVLLNGSSTANRQLGWPKVPDLPSRDIPVLPVREHPKKESLAEARGQARLLHDLASIELQAMELAIRTLVEFPDADPDFRRELGRVACDEGTHLQLCLEGLTELGSRWGDWPVHLALWQATDKDDSLVERIFIVHRYLEGSGLDASESILKRLSGVIGKNPKSAQLAKIIQRIRTDEMLHVQFGSRWFHRFVEESPDRTGQVFSMLLAKLEMRIPRRLEAIQSDLRREAGFLDQEIQHLQRHRDEKIKNLG